MRGDSGSHGNSPGSASVKFSLVTRLRGPHAPVTHFPPFSISIAPLSCFSSQMLVLNSAFYPACQFCSRSRGIKRAPCDRRDLRQESTTLRQTKLSGAGRAHSGKLCLQLQQRHNNHQDHNYDRLRRPRRFAFFFYCV